ncbi:MAG: DUF3179 domain-containing (seleno)protein [Acidobacteriota bacterium]
MICHSGVGLTPVVEGRLHHFSAGGLHNGLILLIDDETRTYWDHITGEAVRGPLRGRRLESWAVRMTTAGAALAGDPDLAISRSGRGLLARWLGGLARWQVRGRGLMPFFFHRTMEPKDRRRPTMDQGLGVVVGTRARYYPLEALRAGARAGTGAPAGLADDWSGRRLRLFIDPADRIPAAEWEDGGRPFQIFTRWYGFSFTYPGCEIYRGPGGGPGGAGSGTAV